MIEPRDVNLLLCSRCHRPVYFEFTVESETWNRIVRARGESEYLCFWCFDELAQDAGETQVPVGVNVVGKVASSGWCENDVPNAYAHTRVQPRDPEYAQ